MSGRCHFGPVIVDACVLVIVVFGVLVVPFIVFTTCCPHNQIRKQTRTRVICMESVFSIVSLDSNRESRCRVGVGVSGSSVMNRLYLFVRKLELVPSIVFTTCCPYNQVRKERKTRVICMQSVFCIVSRSSDRENWCRVGATIVVVVVRTTSRRVRILVTWCNFAPIACICSVFVLGFSSRCQNLNCSERSPYNNAVRRIVLSLVLVVRVCTYFYRVSFLIPFYVGTGTISNIRAV